MSQVSIRRITQQVSATISTAAGLATTLNLEGFSGGVVDIGTLSTSVTSLQAFAASSAGGSFRALRKVDGSAVSITLQPSTAAGGVYALPDEVFAVPYLRLVGSAAESEGVPAVVTLKS